MLRVRGILDEIHPGEVDPGMFRIFDAGDNLVGFFWKYNPGASHHNQLILFKNYEDQVPGDPGSNYQLTTTLTFTWDHKRLTMDQAKNEWKAANPGQALEFVVTHHPADNARIIEHVP